MRRRVLIQGVASALLAGASVAPAMAAPRVRFILCLLGPEGWLPTVARHVQAYGHGFSLDREFSTQTADERMSTTFTASWDRVPPTHTDDDHQAVRAHRSVAYVLSQDLTADTSAGIAARALGLIDTLFVNGALACKCDSAGVAHGAKRWRTLAAGMPPADRHQRGAILYRAFVRRPLSDEGVLYSCGMHLLGCPDIEYLGPRNELAATALIDDAAKAVLDGDTGGLPHSPCTRYQGDFFFDNPYGYLRLEEAR